MLNYYIGMLQKQEIFTLIGGRVRIMRGRYNPTSDAVWLAAFADDNNINTVLDVGIGTGGAALCLMAHKPNLTVTGIDISPDMLAECDANAKLNDKKIELINDDIANWKTNATFDLVMTNPPYFFGTPARHNAHHNADLDTWTKKCIARVRPRGKFATIVDAGVAARIIAITTQSCGDITVFPLFGAKNTAERVLISARVGTRGPAIFHRGTSMNNETILRDGLTISNALATLGSL